MSTKYKVWVNVEEINEEADHYENIDIPVSIAEFDNKDEAFMFVDQLLVSFKPLSAK